MRIANYQLVSISHNTKPNIQVAYDSYSYSVTPLTE